MASELGQLGELIAFAIAARGRVGRRAPAVLLWSHARTFSAPRMHVIGARTLIFAR
jgi:hypothetical protein